MSKINPYYSPEKLGLEVVSLDEDGLDYEYNTLAFFKSPNGVYLIADHGCSCPTPFEDYESTDTADFERQAEKVLSLEDAEYSISSWNRGYSERVRRTRLDNIMSVVEKLREWGLK